MCAEAVLAVRALRVAMMPRAAIDCIAWTTLARSVFVAVAISLQLALVVADPLRVAWLVRYRSTRSSASFSVGAIAARRARALSEALSWLLIKWGYRNGQPQRNPRLEG